MLKCHYMYFKKKLLTDKIDKLNKSTGHQNLFCISGASIFSSALYWKKYDYLGL
jgi:hypothetical protein